jgi:hypothetical protein
MAMRYSFGSQIHNNIVALVSLTIAVSGFSYSLWRNEQTEKNRNIRTASFEVLMEVEQLRLIVDSANYEKDKALGNPITGWPHVLLIKDLSHLIDTDTGEAGDNLYKVWSDNWDSIDSNPDSAQKVTSAIEEMRGQDLKVLRMLR